MAEITRLLFLIQAVLCCLVRSQLGPDNCTVTEDIMSDSVVFVPPGSTVCFQCVLSGSVATDATFQINSGSVDPSDGRTEMGVLVIYDTTTVFVVQQPAAIGCTSISEAESATSTVILHIFQPPVISGQSTVDEGDTLGLDCNAGNSQPLPSVEWFTPDTTSISITRTLEIPAISRNQAGDYTCVATDSLSGAQENSTVLVTVNVNSEGPDDCIESVTLSAANDGGVVYVATGVVCFQCDFGFGVDTLSMFQLDNNDVPRTMGNTVQGVLVIFRTDLVFSADLHTVTCTSDGGSLTINAFLRVFQPPVISGQSTVDEGDTLSLDCNAGNSQPLPSVEWFTPDATSISITRTLEIPAISRNQAGDYTCVATDSLSGAQEGSVSTVIVQYAPEVTTTHAGTQFFPVGGTLELTCNYQGIPSPNTITWVHNGTALSASDADITITSDDESTEVMRSSLLADGGGMYTCTAMNIVGSASEDISVRIQLPPGPPTSLAVVDSTATSLELSWINPAFLGFSVVASYRVTVRDEESGTMTERVLQGVAMRYNVTGLNPYRMHTLGLHVTNEAGLDGEATMVTGNTLSLRLPEVATFILEVLSSTEIRVQWTAPTVDVSTTAPVDSYTVTFQLESGEAAGGMQNVDSSTLTHTLEGLEKGTQYTVAVVAVNTVGPGEPRGAVVETLVDAPSPPRQFNVTSPTPFSLNLSWIEPLDDGGRPVTGYRILTNSSVSVVEELLAGTLSFQIDSLMQDTAYELVLSAVNSADLESENETLVASTQPVGPPQVPDIPNIPGIELTDRSATINWADPGGYPYTYILQYKPASAEWSDTNSTVTVNISASSLPFTLTGLLRLTVYTVRLASQNINGVSEFSSEASFGTFGGISIDSSSTTPELHPSGEPVTLSCTLQATPSSPSPQYTWSRVGEPLPDDIIIDNGMLTLQDPEFEDSGVYVCSAQGITVSFSLSIDTEDNNSDSLVVWIIVGAVVGTVVVVSLATLLSVLAFCVCYKHYEKYDFKGHTKRTELQMKSR